MGFCNMQQGDVPYFKRLADKYTVSDNDHQPDMGGTGLDHVLGNFGDDIWHSDGQRNPATPPGNEIENPNPASSTNKWYTQDGCSGGSYSACSDTSRPGVGQIVSYLQSLPKAVKPNCDPGHSYLLNNYNPGYFGNGTLSKTMFTIPPISTPGIGNVLEAAGVSFAWFGDGWNQYVTNPNNPSAVYCNICNPLLYQTIFTTNPALRTAVNKDTSDLYVDLRSDALPAVAFVKPGRLNDGHPASPEASNSEAFFRKILTELRQQPNLWKSTAVFMTADETGGYYHSGYVQPLDFFRDGPRIPLIVVSRCDSGDHVNHSYADHTSLVKIIEGN